MTIANRCDHVIFQWIKSCRYEIGEYAEMKLSKLKKRWDDLAASGTTTECPLKRVPIGEFTSAKFYSHVSRSTPVILSGSWCLLKLLISDCNSDYWKGSNGLPWTTGPLSTCDSILGKRPWKFKQLLRGLLMVSFPFSSFVVLDSGLLQAQLQPQNGA